MRGYSGWVPSYPNYLSRRPYVIDITFRFSLIEPSIYIELNHLYPCFFRTECGKYAAYCGRALERAVSNGPRQAKPSRMEVLSILLKNPHHHSLPHAMPVHFANETYSVVGFDGSTTIAEFLADLNVELGCRPVDLSGFTIFSDDPLDKDLYHALHLEDRVRFQIF